MGIYLRLKITESFLGLQGFQGNFIFYHGIQTLPHPEKFRVKNLDFPERNLFYLEAFLMQVPHCGILHLSGKCS